MLEAIEKLLVLQECDRKILQSRAELNGIGPRRHGLQTKASSANAALEAARLKLQKTESERKKLELDVEARKQQIDRYSQQQLQTKKNEEYRALAHEIDHCRTEIARLEDQQLELMEQGEQAQRELNAAQQEAHAARKLADGQLAALAKAEADLQKQLAELEAERAQLAGAVEETALHRYERLLRSKGGRVVVGVDNGVCGGCHMKFPVQIMVACRTGQELVTCPNCGRILYYTADMNMPAPA